ncbi:Galactose-binding domain-like [Plasmopara halstedii]|uniref:Galactose-binding domain-like n=1 Tax=Plasmopara halstedii TaxID=4781 RepID=A0A0P1B327_PLAHL|nr:Galactose-binding domain-like [Plasmopara halstedii]CEG48871.1 Galactose-binding domain-like [Plasmopara halstedii]|eukprot:XP_024585240.1 Galactose-binding domain-like [Plasmopara halstedii]
MAGKRWQQQRQEIRNKGVKIIGFQVRSATSAAGAGSTNNLLQYSTRACWQSYVSPTETLILALETKALLSEIQILNKNACTVSVSVAVQNKQRSYIHVTRMENLPHNREVRVLMPFFPCNFVRLHFEQKALPYIAVYAIQPLGISSDDIEAECGPALCTILNQTTENLLFGSSLRASQSFMDCLSAHYSGSPEWMASRRKYLLDERIARLEAALFD